jgi:hypothetical protein
MIGDRYDYEKPVMRECLTGDWVKYEDYEKLQKELIEVKIALYKLLDFAKENYINDDDFYNDWQTECDLVSYNERWNKND